MGYEGITLVKEAGIATLTLNRPERLNAFSLPMIKSMGEALLDVQQDDRIKVLIITGAGRGFCSGLDVTAFKEVAKMSEKEVGDLMRSVSLPLYNFPKLSIAAINGVAVGGGLALALLCDMRIASEKAKFASVYTRIGIIPDIGLTYSLPRIVGVAKALELIITGDTFDASEAHRMGILNRVVPQEELANAARELAERVVKGPSTAIELAKRAVYRGIHNSFEQQIEFECFAGFVCLATEDHKEGVKALMEKRQPEFRGRQSSQNKSCGGMSSLDGYTLTIE